MTQSGKAARVLALAAPTSSSPSSGAALLPTTSSVVHSQMVEVGDEAESVRIGYNRAPKLPLASTRASTFNLTYPSSSFDIYGAHRLQMIMRGR